MRIWIVILLVAMAAVVMSDVMDDDDSDWFNDFIEEYKRRPRPPPRTPALQRPVRRSELEKMKRSCENPSAHGISQANCIRSLMRRLVPPYSCISYGKGCSIKNHQHQCCRGMGCYSGSGNDCTSKTRCICRRPPELKYVYYTV